MSMARRIEAEFITRRIPYSVVGGIRIDEAAHIKDLLSIARLACNLEHEPAWLRLLHRYPKIGDKAAAQIVERIAKSRSVAEAVQLLGEEEIARKTKFSGLAHALMALSDLRTPAEVIAHAAALMHPFWTPVWPANGHDTRTTLHRTPPT